MNPSRLMIVIPHLGPGGTQKVALWLADRWIGENTDVTLVTLFRHEKEVYSCPSSAQRVCLPRPQKSTGTLQHSYYWEEGKNSAKRLLALSPFALEQATQCWRWLRRASPEALARRSCEKRIKELREVIRSAKPDLILALGASSSVISVEAAYKLSIPTLIAERNDPALQILPTPYQEMRPRSFAKADVVTANSAAAAATIRAWSGNMKPVHIPNPVEVPPAAEAQVRGTRLITVARLVPQKSTHLILEAMALLPGAFDEWTLTIVGDGPERHRLEQRAAALNLSDRVRFTGHLDSPSVELATSSVFISASQYEGMSNALTEAMAAGLPVIVDHSVASQVELVRSGETGLTVEVANAEDLSRAMQQLAEDASLRSELGQAARRHVAQYDPDSVFEQWRACAQQALARRSAEELAHAP